MIEIIWIIISLAGIAATHFALERAKKDHHAASSMSNGRSSIRMAIASGALFRHRVRLVIFTWWLLIGVLALVGEVIPRVDPLPDIPRLAGLFGLIGTAIGHVFIVFHESHENNVLDDIVLRVHGLPETQDQREDREFGDKRRRLEQEHTRDELN